jgi:uncharacterized tellurite resistance protein B-like protein
MPALVLFVTVLGAAAFWLYRLRDLGHAAHGAIDTAQRLRGFYRRYKFRKQAELSPIASVDDPAAAGVAMLIALASARGALSDQAEAAIRHEIAFSMLLPRVDEVFTFARWVADHASTPNDLSFRFSGLWTGALSEEERASFLHMATRIVAIDGDPLPAQAEALRRLGDRLGLSRQ